MILNNTFSLQTCSFVDQAGQWERKNFYCSPCDKNSASDQIFFLSLPPLHTVLWSDLNLNSTVVFNIVFSLSHHLYFSVSSWLSLKSGIYMLSDLFFLTLISSLCFFWINQRLILFFLFGAL